MSEAPTSPAAPPRTVKFDTISDVAAEVRRLRRGHTQAGRWTLPQAAWHLGLAIDNCLKPVPPGTVSTPEQAAAKQSRLDPMLAAGVMPPGRPMPPGVDPLADAGEVGDAAIDNFLAGLQRLDAFPHPQVAFSFVGVISTEEFKSFVRIHSANHLAHFVPAPPPRPLAFADENAVIAEIERLRRDGYDRRGDWTLEQTAWHLATLMEAFAAPPDDPNAEPTPEQAARLNGFLAMLEAPGGASKFPAGPFQPPATASDTDVDRLIAAFRKLRDYPHAKVVMGPLGPQPVAAARKAHLLHAAHHLGFLAPRG